MAIKSLDSDDIKPAQKEAKHITDLREDPIEIDTDRVVGSDALDLEAFMHEVVKVRVHGSPEEGALPVISVTVNGITQPIPRDVEVPVKRKYIEALARAKSTSYKQVVNPVDPSDIRMVPTTVPSYPFSVIEDTPRGKAWLKQLLAEPA